MKYAKVRDILFKVWDKATKDDIDGRIKPVLDLLQKANIVEDDSVFNDLIIRKRFDKEHPRIEIYL